MAALAGAAAIAAQLTGVVPAQAAAPAITIFATSKLAPVTGDAMIVYLGGLYGSATVHGKITGTAAGEVAALYGQQFPYKKPPVRLATVTLKSGALAYSFTVAPDLATRYAVRLFASGTAKAPLATSKAQNLYVLAYRYYTGGKSCANDRPVCHETFHIYTIVPASALGTEIGQHVYPYVGVSLSSTGVAGAQVALPERLPLRRHHGTPDQHRRRVREHIHVQVHHRQRRRVLERGHLRQGLRVRRRPRPAWFARLRLLPPGVRDVLRIPGLAARRPDHPLRPAHRAPWALRSLRAGLLLHPAGHAGNEYLVTDELGIPLHPESYSDEFTRMLKRAGLPKIRLHDSRTTLSLMEKAGVPSRSSASGRGHYDSSSR